MKKSVITMVVVAIFALCIIACTLPLRGSQHDTEYIRDDSIAEYFIITAAGERTTNYLFANGCVATEEDAVKIAEIIFESVFGKDYNDLGLPLVVGFDDNTEVWMIKTQLPRNWLGGCKYLSFRKSNAEIVDIWATL